MTLTGERMIVGMALSSRARHGPPSVEVMVAGELNPVRGQCLANNRVTQSAHLHFALNRVAAGVIGILVTRMAAQFGDAFPDFRPQHPREARNADLVEMGLAAPLPVKLREVADRRMLAQRQLEMFGKFEKLWQRLPIPVRVVVGVDVCR